MKFLVLLDKASFLLPSPNIAWELRPMPLFMYTVYLSTTSLCATLQCTCHSIFSTYGKRTSNRLEAHFP